MLRGMDRQAAVPTYCGLHVAPRAGAVNQYNMMYLLQNVTGLYLQETIPSYNATA
jgi:hypothetical protein